MSFKLITWEQFVTTNLDSRGIRYKFEDLCRQLFANEYLSSNKKYRNIHSNPNNPGLESEPIYDEVNDRMVGYQVKFFEVDTDYDQILHSAEKIVEYYDEKVNHVVLYCNKQISVTAKNYENAKRILDEHHISLELITGDTILDQVRKYPYLASYYFGSHSITYEWLKKYNENMFDEMGERFNSEFNVDTYCSNQLSLFTLNDKAIKYINDKKENLLAEIDLLYQKYTPYHSYFSYLDVLKNKINEVENIDYEHIEDSFDWEKNLKAAVKAEIEQLASEKARLEENQLKFKELAFGDNELSDKEKEDVKNKYFDIRHEIDKINKLMCLPSMLEISDAEQKMIKGKILAVKGDAGMGKSQLLAYEVNYLNRNNRSALLLLAGLYFSDDPIQKQVMNNCMLDFSFDDFIDILEVIGEVQGKVVPIFIDALNETWNNDLWKTFLPLVISKIENCKYVKLAFSYRTEYEQQLMNKNLTERIKNGSICSIYQIGFEQNTVEAINKFFDYYGIPFTPSEYLEYRMVNPLFLTLYCRTYKGDEVDLPTLYERLLDNANTNIHKSMKDYLRGCGYIGTENLLTPFIDELSCWLADKGLKSISKAELISFTFWQNYGIKAPPFINQIIREQILHSYIFEGKEILYFAYDQMNDYFIAKAIVQQANSIDEIREKIIDDILQIKDGEINNFGNRDLFINISILCRNKFGEECIDLIDQINDSYEKDEFVSCYIKSFQWRNKDTIDIRSFINYIMTHKLHLEDLWKVLIGNSVKIEHPLNADFLHSLLMKYALNKRDYLWTTYINYIFSNDANRVTQLINMYNKGQSIEFNSKKQTELLLILFGWLLTASDRLLRDYTSKAMIEIMKYDFDLCEIILRKFENVNDPYVLQRLYGIVFGACCKRIDSQIDVLESLSKYIYKRIFDQEYVYPDILLRDYARLVIERFLWEKPEYHGVIDRKKIIPPYKSENIPVINEDYTDVRFNGGLHRIWMSMRFESMGMYGDFGRYVFQSALHNFNVDHKQIFNYAMSFIINDLGYADELFDDFDCHMRMQVYNRYTTAKLERIGKKYQWIAMYNILARVTDYYKMNERYGINGDTEISYNGAWAPYVRDFDPTLNSNFMVCNDAPTFNQPDDFIAAVKLENTAKVVGDSVAKKLWLEEEGVFFSDFKNTFILKDSQGIKWVTLTRYLDTGYISSSGTDKLLIWSWVYAYFVTQEQEAELFKNLDLKEHDLCSYNQEYTIYNREYPWSPACKQLRESAWIDVSIKTGDKETVTETVEIPEFSFDDAFLEKLSEESDSKGPFKVVLKKETKTFERDIEKSIGKILHASSDLMWEEAFDASKPEAISWRVPCAEFVEFFNLKQLKSDSFYYDIDGNLAAFDTRFTQDIDSIVVRKDLLDVFLEKNGMKLVWILNAGKEIHNKDLIISQDSYWKAILAYDNDDIKGDIVRVANE